MIYFDEEEEENKKSEKESNGELSSSEAIEIAKIAVNTFCSVDGN